MTDTEILDWLEREKPLVFPPNVEDGLPHWLVDAPAMQLDSPIQAEAPTLREAVEKAARENGDES